MEEGINEDGALHVKMFGKFSMWYRGASLLEKNTNETQFAYVMQLVLHYRKEGISRERMEEILFGDRDISNVHHTMQSVIYNVKNKLKKAGLPKANYIRMEKGIFYWTDEIPVEEDVCEFERFYDKAFAEKDADAKLRYLTDACSCYTGEFLASYAGVIWAAVESRKYREMFIKCVEESAEILRDKQDFPQMEQLGKRASAIAPFSDWETITMEALIGMGRYEEASELYAETVDSYFEERGIRPSKKLMDFMSRLGEQLVHPYEQLDEIQSELMEEQEDTEGGYLCSYPIFRGIYQMVLRMIERGGQSVYLMLCTVVDSKGSPMKEGKDLDILQARLGDAICRSIRQGDVVNHFSRGQYLVLLMNTTREDCLVVQKRINYRFLIGRQRTGVQYYVNSVIRETI